MGARELGGESTSVTDRSSPLLRASQVSKSFGGVAALRKVDFSAFGGEVHALLGGNGSGKSTLTKILSGVLNADSGIVTGDGAEYDARTITPAAARSLGVRVVHQQDTTFADLTVAENLALGSTFITGPGARIRWTEQNAHTDVLLQRHDVPARARDRVGDLRPAVRTLVAVVRGLSDSESDAPRILFVDEPTAALPAKEAAWLIAALRGLAASGHAIVFISHRIREVLEVADRFTVLRDGRVFGCRPRAEIDERSLVEMIVGEELATRAATSRRMTSVSEGDPFEIRRLETPTGQISVQVSRGEIVGIAGLVGSGRSRLLRALAGLAPVDGEVHVNGAPVDRSTPAKALRSGLVFLPESRADSAFPDQTVAANVMAAVISRYWRRGWLDDRRARARARELINKFDVQTSSETATFATLSGGNQQKILFGRCLEVGPSVLLLDEPTQGVDVGARYELHEIIRRSAGAGTSVLVVSSDFDELASLCDRVLFLRDGQFVAEIAGPELSETAIADRVHAGAPTLVGSQ